MYGKYQPKPILKIMIIYLITNKINGKKYLGRDAWNRKSYYGGGVAIKNAIKKYGKENFKKEIVEQCKDTKHLLERETYWLEYYDAANNPEFYNMINSNKGWEKGKSRPKGRVNSKKTRALISKNGRGKTGKSSGVKSPVEKYEVIITYKLIKSYDSVKQAAEMENIKGCDITAVCSKRQKTAGGYFWKYKK
jgi:hypothetical protein